MALSYKEMRQPRRIGMRTERLRYGSLLQNGPHAEAKPREQKQRSPSIDVDAPPKDSSDEASTVHSIEISDTESIPSKKRKIGSYQTAFKSTSESPKSRGNDTSSELPNEPSNLPLTNFSSMGRTRRPDGSHKRFKPPSQVVRAVVVVGSEDPIDTWTMKPKKTKTLYGGNPKNIHVAASPAKKKDVPKNADIRAVKKGATGFLALNEEAVKPLLDKIKDETPGTAFKAPLTPRTKRATDRLSRKVQASPLEGRPVFIKQSNLPPSRDITPTNGPMAQSFIVPLIVPKNATSPKATRSSKFKKNPEVIEITSKLRMDDLTSLIEVSKDKLRSPDMQYRDPISSITASSIPSTSFDDDSSLSSISSAPDSPELEELKAQFAFPELGKSTYYKPPSAKCPICQERVERAFLEDFDSGARLNIRQQASFCRAHKARSAENEWQAKGYPKIDWTQFDDRLGNFHSVVDDLLKGTKVSFYRNAFEDQVKSGQSRTLKQSLLSGQGSDALAPGYYGSKGARLIMENIMTSFASRIRRLAASDKLISSAGVAGYVQGVLAPELAVMLVMEDMHVDEDEARMILKESAGIGNLLNEEEDEVIRDVDEDEI